MTKKITLILCFLLIATFSLKAQTYNYYFGNIHAHSSYSDGNADSTSSLLTTPLQDFNYANASQHIDFYGISEHNHLSAGMVNPVNFHRGMADADSATANGSFVAMYGMEWGVISGGGHVIVYGYDSLMGWDHNDYDVYVPQDDYASLFKKINEKPGAFAYLAHPQTTDYGNLFANAVDLASDNAIVGMAARSGPAFSTNTSYSNPYTGNYIARYNDALKRGYHVGIGLDHDTHNSVFGRQTAGRMVVLAPSLTRQDILDAIRNMRMYSSDDWNVQVNFTISNLPMGSSLTQTGTPTIKATITDPDVSESVTSIAIYYGVPGSGINASLLTTVTNTASLSYVHNITNNSSYYYYLKITQNDGNIIWTSPIWYTRNDAITNNPPVSDFTASSSTICVGGSITLTDNSSNAPANWTWTLAGATPSTSIHQSVVASYYTTGTYTINLITSNSFGTSVIKTNTITVLPLPNLIASADTICKGESDSLRVTGASSYSWSTGATGPAIYVSPLVTYYYVVTGTLSGCSKTIPVTLIVNTCVGIEELSEETFKLFPNPANQLLTIDVNQTVGEKTIKIYDVLGNLVQTKTSNQFSINIDVSEYNNGIYLVKVILENNKYAIKRFVIEK